MSPVASRIVLGALVSIFGLACAAPADEPARDQPELGGGGTREPRDDEEGGGSSRRPPAPSSPSPPSTASPAAPQPTEAPNSRTCATAREVGATLSGDVPSESVSVSGACSDWLRLRVEETSRLSIAMRLTARLRSPSADNYDLFVYLVEDGEGLACSLPVAVGQSGTDLDEVTTSWGDHGLLGSGVDDSRTVVLEVRKKTGGCSVSPWTLEVQGGAE